ncbi:MAG: GTPase ObgE [Candidatus Saccharibacteria bacterium]
MFIDVATVKIQAGNGGNGYLSFHRTKGNAKGGPDGGDGGNGGDVILRASHNTSTLSKYRTSKLWAAQDGEQGGSNRRHGKNGESVVLLVPPGTVVFDNEELLADLTKDGQEAVIAKGGKGGFGNTHFKSSVRQAPQMAELGEQGEAKTLKLELKIVADVGLIGLPNAGKSTLLSVVSSAKPEIANYAFTTLVPNLGVVDIDGKSLLLADIPGLIEGASKGKGLGIEFLRHVERCRVLLQLIDATSTYWGKDYQTVRDELSLYSAELGKRPYLVVITKSESVAKADLEKKVANFSKQAKLKKSEIYTISAVANTGIVTLLRAALTMVEKSNKQREHVQPEEELEVITLAPGETWEVSKEKEGYKVSGTRLERFAARTNFDQPDGIRRLRDILTREGVGRELTRLGAERGDTIIIAKKKLQW